jgi:hypothetical protein
LNRSKRLFSLQDKGRVDAMRQAEEHCVDTKKAPLETATPRKRKRSEENAMPSNLPSEWNINVSEPEVIVIDDVNELTLLYR